MSDMTARPWRWSSAWTLSLFVLVVAGRLLFVSLYAESVPYWDQWDAEGARLLKPWVEGALTPADLVSAHNEHRILLTRLVSLALFEINGGQWDNLVSAYANVFIYALVPALLFFLLQGGLRARSSRVILFFVLLALAWLPYAWENTRVGFQSQFFFMSLLAIIGIWLAAGAKDGLLLPMKVAPPAIIGLFTMASGILGAIAAGGVLTLRVLLRQLRPHAAIPAVLLLATITVAGFAAIPHIGEHDVHKAGGAVEWFGHFLSNLGWPLSSRRYVWVAIWLPTLLGAWRVIARRSADRHELFALGIAAWAILQAAVIAYSRGALSPRYLDTMSAGLIANLWLAIRLVEHWRAEHAGRTRLSAVPAAVLLLACTIGFVRSTPGDLAAATENTQLSSQQIINVRGFVSSGDRGFLDDKPRLAIPYPWPDRLASLLSDPTLRAALPASVRAPLPLTEAAGTWLVKDDLGLRISSCTHDSTDCLQATGQWRSAPLTSRLPYLQWPLAVDGDPVGISLGVDPDPASTDASTLPADATLRARLFVPVPVSSPFALAIADSSSTSAVHARAPVEVGRLSRLAMRLQDWIRIHAGHRTSDSLQRDRLEVTAPAMPDARRALVLAPGQLARFAWSAPRSGSLAGVAVLIGNYGQSADGMLTAQICTGGHCASTRSDLSRSADNQHLELALPAPLAVHAGELLTFEFSTEAATRPVAFWLDGPAPGAATTDRFGDSPVADLHDLHPPLRLVFRD